MKKSILYIIIIILAVFVVSVTSPPSKDNWYIAGIVQRYVDNGWLLRNKVKGINQNSNIVTNSDYR